MLIESNRFIRLTINSFNQLRAVPVDNKVFQWSCFDNDACNRTRGWASEREKVRGDCHALVRAYVPSCLVKLRAHCRSFILSVSCRVARTKTKNVHWHFARIVGRLFSQSLVVSHAPKPKMSIGAPRCPRDVLLAALLRGIMSPGASLAAANSRCPITKPRFGLHIQHSTNGMKGVGLTARESEVRLIRGGRSVRGSGLVARSMANEGSTGAPGVLFARSTFGTSLRWNHWFSI